MTAFTQPAALFKEVDPGGCADEGFGTVLARHLLAQGFITLPSGPGGRVLSWTPPLTIGLAETKRFLQAVSGVLDTLSRAALL